MKKLAQYISLGLIAGLLVTGCGTGDATSVSTESGIAQAAGTASSVADTESSVADLETSVTPVMDLASFRASDYVTLGDYSEIVLKKADIEPTEEALQAKIKEFTTSHAPADYEAKDGDTVNIDYVGKKDGVAFDGGTAQGYDLTLGSNTFIDGFEAGLIGAKAGDKRSLDLTFPENYGSADLAGAAVVFEVTVNSIAPGEPVEYTDELVAAYTDKKTTAEYNEVLNEEIRSDNKTSASSEAIMNLGTFTGSYPEGLENYYYDYYTQAFITQYGADTLKEVTKNYASTRDFIKERVGSSIEQYMRADLLLLAVAEKENITCEGDDYDAYIDNVLSSVGVSREDLFAIYGEGFVNCSYLKDRAYALLNDRIVIKD